MRVSKSDTGASMTDTATIARHYQHIVRRVGGPLEPHETKESWDAKVARLFGVLPRRIRAVRTGRVRHIGAVEYENAKRIEQEHRQREIERLEQQLAVAYARCRDDKNAFLHTLAEIVGPGHPVVTKLSGGAPLGAGQAKDGEA